MGPKILTPKSSNRGTPTSLPSTQAVLSNKTQMPVNRNKLTRNLSNALSHAGTRQLQALSVKLTKFSLPSKERRSSKVSLQLAKKSSCLRLMTFWQVSYESQSRLGPAQEEVAKTLLKVKTKPRALNIHEMLHPRSFSDSNLMTKLLTAPLPI